MKCPKCQTVNSRDSQYCKKCATALPLDEGRISFTETLETPPEELTRGTVFAGRYEIIEELGAGGMGRVYRVHDTKLNEEMALKLIKPEIAADKRTVERFRNEIKVAHKISHKNVCRTHDLHEEGKALFLTMEYVRGEDLKSFIKRSTILSTGRAISIAKQVAEGLGEAHKLGIVHRDLKPGNVMIDKDGNAKIMDFGIARSLHGGGTTVEGAIIGTPEYMSPEQVDGKPADQRADIYALGVILFEMVTGRPPFEGETAFSIANKHKNEPAPDPRTLNPQMPVDLSRLILRCLEKEKEKRYQTTAELMPDLEAVEASLPTAERAPDGRPPTKPKPATSKTLTVKITPKKLIIPAAVVLVIVAVIVALQIIRPPTKPSPASVSPDGVPSVAILYFKTPTGDKNLDTWRQGLSDALIIKLFQSRKIRVLDQSQIYSILKRLNLLEQDNFTPDELKEIASRTLASHIVLGSLKKAGERYRVDLTLQGGSTLEVIASESADGTGEDSIFTMVDDLADKLKRDLGLTAQQESVDSSKKFGDVTTNSIEALKYYLQGNQRMLSAPLDPASISFFKKAVAVDPQFASAYLMIAMNFYYRSQPKEADPYIRKALDLRERVSEREKYLIEATYINYASERNWDKAIDAYSNLITIYPWDLLANSELGWLYLAMEEWDKAIERFEVVKQYKYENAVSYHGLAWSYLAKGQPDKAKELLESYLNTIADNNHIRANLGMVFCILGDFAKAKVEIEKAYERALPEDDRFYKLFFLLLRRDFTTTDSFFGQWEADIETGVPIMDARSFAFAAQGRIKEAIANFDHMIERYRDKMSVVVASRFAAFLEMSDDFYRAQSVCDECLKSAREMGDGGLECAALYRRGIIQARQGKLEEAGLTAEELRLAVEAGPAKNRIRFYEGLAGLIALLRKDPSAAQGHLQKAINLAPIEGVFADNIPELLDFQAEAYELLGRLEDARRSYEELQSIKIPNLFPANALISARSYYKLGKVLERQGDKAGAAKNYGKFLDLWKDADPGLPEVEDAKKRLAGLTGS